MKNLLFLLLTTFLFASCSNDPEGIWQSDKNEKEKIVILKNESNISVRLPYSRNWMSFISIGSDEYMNRNHPNRFKFLSNDKMQYIHPNQKDITTFSRIVLAGDVSYVNNQMTRGQVKKLIGEPKEKYTEKLAEKWLYESGLLLTFDDQGVFKSEIK